MSQLTEVTLKLNGETNVIGCDRQESILDAALREGLNAPYSCMSGSCTACMAQLKSGTVHMEYADALTDEERAEGKILTCQAKPTSDKVEIEYP